MEVRITVKVAGALAIVRKEVRLSNGELLWKAGLSHAGDWVMVGEGEVYPEACWLPVVRQEEGVEDGA